MKFDQSIEEFSQFKFGKSVISESIADGNLEDVNDREVEVLQQNQMYKTIKALLMTMSDSPRNTFTAEKELYDVLQQDLGIAARSQKAKNLANSISNVALMFTGSNALK